MARGVVRSVRGFGGASAGWWASQRGRFVTESHKSTRAGTNSGTWNLDSRSSNSKKSIMIGVYHVFHRGTLLIPILAVDLSES